MKQKGKMPTFHHKKRSYINVTVTAKMYNSSIFSSLLGKINSQNAAGSPVTESSPCTGEGRMEGISTIRIHTAKQLLTLERGK